jgi:hypothetical protein
MEVGGYIQTDSATFYVGSPKILLFSLPHFIDVLFSSKCFPKNNTHLKVYNMDTKLQFH